MSVTVSPDLDTVPARRCAGLGGEAIRRYDELKLQIAAVSQAAMQRCRAIRDDEGVGEHQALLARLAEDRFNLAVLGQFSRGKSSLMNAILGVDRLPTGLLPHTSVITFVTYGEQERVVIRQEGWSLPYEVPLAQLAEYVTEEGNPGNRRRVTSAEVQLPLEILRRGLFFIDTPGVNSPIAANTLTTRQFLPQVDGAIFVTSFDSPLSDTEIEFLRDIHRVIGKVFVVINKLDLVSDRDRSAVLDYAAGRLASALGENEFELFAVSARDALRAKLAGDREGLEQSGLGQLETALVGFLRSGKSRQFCRRVLDRLIALLEKQRIEASLAASKPDDSGAALTRLKTAVDAIHARRAALKESIRTAAGELNSRLKPTLDPIFAQLHAEALAKFAPCLSQSRRALFELSRAGTLLRAVSSFLAKELSSRIAGCGAAIEKEFEACAGPQLAEFKGLPRKTWIELVALAGAAGTMIEQPAVEDFDSGAFFQITVARFAEIDLRRQVPWFVYFAPPAWVGEAINDWLAGALWELLSGYRTQAHRVIDIAVDDFLSRLDREVEKRIDLRAKRLLGLIATQTQTSHDVQSLDSLIARANVLRSELMAAGAQVGHQLDYRALQAAEDAEISIASSCPVCDRLGEALFGFLSKLQYDLATDEAAQHEHARRGGLCAMHTWMYAALTSPHGVCRAYPELLVHHGSALRQAATSSGSASELHSAARSLLQSESGCSVCNFAQRAGIKALAEVLAMQRANTGPQHARPPALCLPHLCAALEAAPDLTVARRLTLAAAASFERTADAMKRFALKFDALRQSLASPQERQAHSTGLARLVGDRRITATWLADDRI